MDNNGTMNVNMNMNMNMNMNVYEHSNHDCSVSEAHHDNDNDNDNDNNNNLNLFHSVALLTADCLGTGILALPAVIAVLGRPFGLTFLILQLPLNVYAGTILCDSAHIVEQQQQQQQQQQQGQELEQTQQQQSASSEEELNQKVQVDQPVPASLPETIPAGDVKSKTTKKKASSSYESIAGFDIEDVYQDEFTTTTFHLRHEHDHSTTDFIGMTRALFPHTTSVTRVVMAIYYCNIFLLLGDYILVMSHAVVALVGGAICLPTAGMVASTLMFAVSQLRTMAKLGRTVSIISLIALFLVVAQCLLSAADLRDEIAIQPAAAVSPLAAGLLLSKFSALASIGFAVGSQKLLLNIRSEMKSKQQAPKALAISLTAYVTLYAAICVLAGPSKLLCFFSALGGDTITMSLCLHHTLRSAPQQKIHHRSYLTQLPQVGIVAWAVFYSGFI